MGIYRDRGRWYFVKRVPRRFAEVDPRQRVSAALHTDSEREARAKAPLIEAEFLAYWEALAAGDDPDAARRYQAARRLAEVRGFAYRPLADMMRGDGLADLTRRAASLAGGDEVAPLAEVEAVLGLVEPPVLNVSAALVEFYKLTADRIAGKSERQIHRWRLDRDRAAANFIRAVGDIPLADIDRAAALEFRAWWQARTAEPGGPGADSANKGIGHFADIFRTVSDLLGLGLESPFRGLRLKSTGGAVVPPFSAGWIKGRLLAPDALAALNAEARDVFLVMVNTGARPSEILGALPEEFATGAASPHLGIRPREGRALKTRQSDRDLPP